MTFDPCPEKMTQLVIKAGKVIRQLKGLPEENNITKLYEETAPLLGIVLPRKTTMIANHLPAPWEMKSETGKFVIPRKDCPKCGSSNSVVLMSLCRSCKDSEGGKYKSAWVCTIEEEHGGNRITLENKKCSYKERMVEAYPKMLQNLGIEIPEGMKADLGIMTMTDDGIKGSSNNSESGDWRKEVNSKGCCGKKEGS